MMIRSIQKKGDIEDLFKHYIENGDKANDDAKIVDDYLV